MKLKKILVAIFAGAIGVCAMGTVAFADGDETTSTDVYCIGEGQEYETLEAARLAAKDTDDDGVITYEIHGKVSTGYTGESIAFVPSDRSGINTINFVGADNTAELFIPTKERAALDGGFNANYGINVNVTNLICARPDGDWSQNFADGNNHFLMLLSRGATLTYTSCKFPNGVASNMKGTTIFNGCEFDNKIGNRTKQQYALWAYTSNDDAAVVQVEGCTFNGSKGVKVYSDNHTATGGADDAVEITNSEFNITGEPALVSSSYGTIELNGNDYEDNGYGVVATTGHSSLTVDGEAVVYVASAPDKWGSVYYTQTVDYAEVLKQEALKNGKAEAEVTVYVAKVSSENGETYHTTIQEVLDVVKTTTDNDITLIDDVSVSGQNALDALTGDTLDLNGHTLTVNGNTYFSNGTTTFTNGDIVVTGYASDSYFCGYTADAVIVFDDVVITGDDYSTGCALINANKGSVEIKNSTITVSGDTTGGVIYGGAVTINNTTINATNVRRGITNSVAGIENGSAFTFDGGETGFNNSTVTVDNSEVAIMNATGRAVRLNNNTLTLQNGATLTATDCAADIVAYAENSNAVVSCDETSELDAEFAAAAKIGNDRFASLQAAVDAAKNGDVVELIADEFVLDDILFVNKSVTISGASNARSTDNAKIIATGNLGYVVANATLGVTFENIDFVAAEGFTGEWSMASSNGNCVAGNAVLCAFGKVSVEGCSFVNNGNASAAIFLSGDSIGKFGNIGINSADSTVTNSTFDSFPTAISMMGDNIPCGKLTITGNTFTAVDAPANMYWGVNTDDSAVTFKDNTIVSALTEDKAPTVALWNYAFEKGGATEVEFTVKDNKVSDGTEIVITNTVTGNIDTDTEIIRNYSKPAYANKCAAVGEKFYLYYDQPTRTKAEMTDEGISYTELAEESGKAAFIDGVYYDTLQKAVDATTGKTGDFTITVLNGTYDEDFIILQTTGRNLTIVPETPGEVILKGNISINGNRSVITYTGGAVTIDGIVFDGSEKTEAHNFIADQKSNSGIKEDKVTTYSHKVTVKNCTFIGSESANVVAFREHQAGAQDYYFYNCTATGLHSFIQAKNVGGDNGLIVENCTITGCKEGINLNSTKYFKMTGTTVDVAGYGLRGGQGSVTNTEMKIELSDNTITAGEHAVILRAGAEGAVMKITSGSYTGAISAIAEAEVAISGGNYSEKPADAHLAEGFVPVTTADGRYAVAEEANVLDTINVEFVKVDAENPEEELLYNINLTAFGGEVINRLNSGDLTFVLNQVNGINKYQIIDIAGDNIAVNPVGDKGRYEFHFSTKTDIENSDTAKTITIAQVKFTGYGNFSFGVDTAANATNAVHTTTIVDNVVDTFVPNPDEIKNEGTLDVSAALEKLEIKVPTRALTISITFPNAVEKQVAAYQQMTVKVSGDDLAKDLVIDLGEQCEISAYADAAKPYAGISAEFVDGAYVIEISELLIKGNTYFVEVTGSGYRTANHTVQMTTEKTLNFWNNVKDAGKAIEVYEVEGQTKPVEVGNTKVTFLAGDIVNDGLINIYDLSAVVSYFGEINLVEDNKYEYAKYDLNRDGLIDSKDVAYVLVSWGK